MGAQKKLLEILHGLLIGSNMSLIMLSMVTKLENMRKR